MYMHKEECTPHRKQGKKDPTASRANQWHKKNIPPTHNIDYIGGFKKKNKNIVRSTDIPNACLFFRIRSWTTTFIQSNQSILFWKHKWKYTQNDTFSSNDCSIFCTWLFHCTCKRCWSCILSFFSISNAACNFFTSDLRMLFPALPWLLPEFLEDSMCCWNSRDREPNLLST